MSTVAFGVTMSTVPGAALAASAFAGAEPRAAASLRALSSAGHSALTGADPRAAASFLAISSTALFGEGVRG